MPPFHFKMYSRYFMHFKSVHCIKETHPVDVDIMPNIVYVIFEYYLS